MNLNPHHPTTMVLSDQWHKLLAIIMLKNGDDHVVITMEDIYRLEGGKNITVQEVDDGIHLRLVDDETAAKLAQLHGGVTDGRNN